MARLSSNPSVFKYEISTEYEKYIFNRLVIDKHGYLQIEWGIAPNMRELNVQLFTWLQIMLSIKQISPMPFSC